MITSVSMKDSVKCSADAIANRLHFQCSVYVLCMGCYETSSSS
jgi:hypothetical protein